jgi:pimeloyl-ACP methyl ester carboxylesterase
VQSCCGYQTAPSRHKVAVWALFIAVGQENTGDIRIYYEDHGAGPPVLLVHGYLTDGLAPVPPCLLRSDANPDGTDPGALDDYLAELTSDRLAAVKSYLDLYYNLDLLRGSRVSDQAWQNSFHVATRVAPAAALGCAAAWRVDFRADLARISVPVLIVQGAEDRVMPLRATGQRLAGMPTDARLVVIPDGPRAIIWTHAAEVNQPLLSFLRGVTGRARAASSSTAAAVRAAIAAPGSWSIRADWLLPS